ncbi:fluoride efflux transporter FluC, partial [Kaarinaea lacus]
AFTTFSTFSMETLNLIEEGDLFKAMLNVALSVVLCLFAAWIGVLAGRTV